MARSPRPSAAAAVVLIGGLSILANPILAQRSDGWTSLFDGTALTNWVAIGDANWAVADGAVQANRGRGYLVSKKSYAGFELQVDVWVSRGTDSGVFFRCVDPRNISAVSCYDVSIGDSRPAPVRTGAIVNVARADVVVNAAEQWTTFDIRAEGRTLTVSLNGIVVSTGEDAAHAAGPIAFERSEGTVRFRRVRIRPLPARP